MARNQSFNRIRKRVFVVTGITLGAVILIASLLAVFATLQLGPEDLQLITVNEGTSRTAILGSGLSLDQADDGNLVNDGSFEPLVFRKMLTVYSGDETTLTVSSEDASSGEFGDGFFNDASARIMTLDQTGLVLKKTANVTNFGINRVGVFNQVLIPEEVPDQLAILDFARSGDQTIAVGQQGLVLLQASSQTPATADPQTTADLTGICSTLDGFYACGSDGQILFSIDGETWQGVGISDASLNAVASNEHGIVAAVGTKGALIVGQDGNTFQLSPLTDSDLNDIVSGQDALVAVGDNGTILTSINGLIWKKADLLNRTDWLAADYRDGRFVAVGRNGAIAISDDGIRFSLFGQDSSNDLVDVVMLTSQQLIVLDSAGQFLVSNDSGKSWLSSGIETGMKSEVIALAGKDKILSADREGNLGIAQLVAEISLDSSLVDSRYQAGDLIFLEMTALEAPAAYLAASDQAGYIDPWQFYGYGSCRRAMDDVSPDGGQGAMLLRTDSWSDDQSAILSQQLNTAAFSSDRANEVYRFELWMKQSDLDDRRVKVWLSDDDNVIIGTTFTNVGTSWKKYSHTFVMPAGSITDSSIVRLNIAIDSGQLWIDQVNLMTASNSSTRLASDFNSNVAALSPQLIRLDFLKIGCLTSRELSWSQTLGNETPYLNTDGWTGQSSGSLYSALQFSDQAGADPWLTIDSFASQTEILSLVEYLAAPISEPYGKRRMDQGSVIPWTGQFDRIILEFKDSNNLFASDQLRADFVDLMISTIARSPYYREIKNKLVFVDGCTYSAGIVLSSADYHATDLFGTTADTLLKTVDNALMSYLDLVPRNPEKQTQNWPEIMRTAFLADDGVNQATMAELTAVLLDDLGHQTGLSMLSLTTQDIDSWSQIHRSAAAVASRAAQGISLEIDTESETIRAQGFKSDSQVSLVFENLSDQAATCLLLTDLPLSGASVYKYDSKGQLISRQTMRSAASKLTVLSGGVVAIVNETD